MRDVVINAPKHRDRPHASQPDRHRRRFDRVRTVITATGAGAVGYVSLTPAGVTISGGIANNSSGTTILGTSSLGLLTVNGVISVRGRPVLRRHSGGNSTLTLGAANTYTGKTLVNYATSGTVKIATNNALPTKTDLVMGVTQSTGVLDLNGFNQTVGGLSTGTSSFIGTVANKQPGDD